MVYPNLKFPKIKGRPFFFTNFVSTIDGKVQVLKDGSRYWPIGSETDFETLLDLRAVSDVLIHGKNTALGFNHLARINSEPFKKRRESLGITEDLQYLIVTSDPDDSLIDFLKNDFGSKALIATTEKAKISEELSKWVKVIRIGKDENVDLNALSKFLNEQSFENILVEGGPTLLGNFLKENLLDELFLTIAPKIFGNDKQATLTLIEGQLFPPESIKQFQLLSVKQIKDELYLRYSVKH